MRLLAAVCLLAQSLFAIANPFVVSDPVAVGVKQCGVYIDGAARVISAVVAPAGTNICKYDLAGIPVGPHSVAMTAITVDDPVWGSQESAQSIPLAFEVQDPVAMNYQGLWWAAGGTESGWGINLAHQGDTIFATWFTYDTSGRGWWLAMTAPKTAPNTYSGTLYQTHGPPFSAAPFNPNNVFATAVGIGTLSFTDANNGTFTYALTSPAVTQTKSLARDKFGPLPICTFGGQPNLALATNYQDLWWAAPAGVESGWGINLDHQGDTIFATWFTYDMDGTPMWLVVTAPETGPGVYAGDLYRTSGARFDAFNPANVVPTKVGTATFTFTNGNNATFAYTITGVGPTPVTQTKTITRDIFAAPGTTCQ